MRKSGDRRQRTKQEFSRVLEPVWENDTVQSMHRFTQHGDTSCFRHCRMVAFYSYRLCRLFGLDAESAARGAMLHDLFLYDWHELEGRGLTHATGHPGLALRHAEEQFILNEKEQDIILHHMWPVTRALPRSREALVVSTMDKYSAAVEIVGFYVRKALDARYRYWQLLLQCRSSRWFAYEL